MREQITHEKQIPGQLQKQGWQTTKNPIQGRIDKRDQQGETEHRQARKEEGREFESGNKEMQGQSMRVLASMMMKELENIKIDLIRQLRTEHFLYQGHLGINPPGNN